MDDGAHHDATGSGIDHGLDGPRAKGQLGGQLGVAAEGVEVLGHGADVVELGVGQRYDLQRKENGI